MTGIEIFSFIILPAIIVAVAYAAVLWQMWLDRRESEQLSSESSTDGGNKEARDGMNTVGTSVTSKRILLGPREGHITALTGNEFGLTSTAPRFRRQTFNIPVPGPYSLPETRIQGRIARIDADGFGFVELDATVGTADLGFFTSKTELANPYSKAVSIGCPVTGVSDAVEIQIPESPGPLTIPLKKLELT